MSKTIYTSTISVPVYAGWRCSKCDEINISQGNIVCQCQTESYSAWRSDQNAAREKASKLAEAVWLEESLTIIADPTHHPQKVRGSLVLEKNRCRKCKAKPKWDKNNNYRKWEWWAYIGAFFIGLLSLPALKKGTDVVDALVGGGLFAVALSIIIYSNYTRMHYIKMMRHLPKRYTPVLGSLNKELNEYAASKGISIPKPNEAIMLVAASDEQPTRAPKKNNATESKTLPNNSVNIVAAEKENQICFCRKCGAKLLDDSEFCHKCGTKIINP